MFLPAKFSFRWIIVFLLFSICVINYIDRSSLAYTLTALSTVFHLDDVKLGLLASAFSAGYIITTILGGILVDRFGVRIILLISITMWGISLFMMSAAHSFQTLLISRIFLGIAEGPYFPAMTKAIGDWLPRKERAIALSGALIAVPVSLAIGAPIVSQLLIYFNWRVMFLILGSIALFWLPFWIFLFKNKPEESKFVSKEELSIIRASESATISETSYESNPNVWKFLLSHKTLMANNWSFFILGAFIFFFMNWLPSFLHQQYGLNLKAEGIFDIFPWALSAIAMLMVSIYSDRILQKTNRLRWSRSYLIIASQLLAGIFIIPTLYAKNVDSAIFFISLSLACCMSTNAVIYAINIDLAKRYTGRALGIMDTFFALSGILIPVVTGAIVELTGTFYGAFMLIALLALSSVLILTLFHQPDQARKAI